MTDYNDVLATLDKNTLKLIKQAKDLNEERLPTASFGVNLHTGGGLGRGKQHTIWGNEGSGKSLFALQTIAINQALGHSCAYLDVERTFRKSWAERNGVDMDGLLLSQATSFADVTNLQKRLIDAKVDLIVIDSTSNLQPGSWLEKGELKDFSDTRQQGQHAAEETKMTTMISGMNYHTAIIHISHVRIDLGAQGQMRTVPLKTTQSEGAKHNDSLRLRLTASKAKDKAIKGEIAGFEVPIGRHVNWLMNKNKLTGVEANGEYDLYTRGDHLGVDIASELSIYGEQYGIIERSGAWYTLYGERFQGGDNLNEYIRTTPEAQDKLAQEIIDKHESI